MEFRPGTFLVSCESPSSLSYDERTALRTQPTRHIENTAESNFVSCGEPFESVTSCLPLFREQPGSHTVVFAISRTKSMVFFRPASRHPGMSGWLRSVIPIWASSASW